MFLKRKNRIGGPARPDFWAVVIRAVWCGVKMDVYRSNIES